MTCYLFASIKSAQSCKCCTKPKTIAVTPYFWVHNNITMDDHTVPFMFSYEIVAQLVVVYSQILH